MPKERFRLHRKKPYSVDRLKLKYLVPLTFLVGALLFVASESNKGGIEGEALADSQSLNTLLTSLHISDQMTRSNYDQIAYDLMFKRKPDPQGTEVIRYIDNRGDLRIVTLDAIGEPDISRPTKPAPSAKTSSYDDSEASFTVGGGHIRIFCSNPAITTLNNFRSDREKLRILNDAFSWFWGRTEGDKTFDIVFCPPEKLKSLPPLGKDTGPGPKVNTFLVGGTSIKRDNKGGPIETYVIFYVGPFFDEIRLRGMSFDQLFAEVSANENFSVMAAGRTLPVANYSKITLNEAITTEFGYAASFNTTARNISWGTTGNFNTVTNVFKVVFNAAVVK